MRTKRSGLKDLVVVITGASSGIGREAALRFARAGSKVALAARRQQDLEDTAEECRNGGGAALVVVTDVAVESEVERLAQATIDAWGRIDVWVNNAGVTHFARLAQGSVEDHRRVIETNLFGAIYGARAVIPIFRRQGRGTLINVCSVAGEVGHPFVPSYAISKAALRGLSDALRMELADEPEVHVCSLLPYAVDTPHFQSGSNDIGLRTRSMPPVQTPEAVAGAIVSLAVRPRRKLHVPRIAVLGLALRALFPTATERLMLRALQRWHFEATPQPKTDGNLYQPVEEGEGAVHGDRPPQLSTAAFAAWSLKELVRGQAGATARWFRAKLTRPHAAIPQG